MVSGTKCYYVNMEFTPIMSSSIVLIPGCYIMGRILLQYGGNIMPLKILSQETTNHPWFGKHTYKYAICQCGREIVLEDFTNWCDHCDKMYDFSGNRLSDPLNWGEETGEHWSDVC